MNECFICNKNCVNVIADREGDKHEDIVDAVDFEASGNWASSLWDPDHGETLSIIICDECLKKNMTKLAVIKRIKRTETVKIPFSLWQY